MDEAYSDQIAAAFHQILAIRRISWALTKTANDDDQRSSDAIRNIFGQQRFCPVRRIIIYGLKNPGTVPELVQHMRGKPRGKSLQMQRVIFTQIAIAMEIGSILQHKSGKKKVTIYAYNPEFSEDTIKGLKHFRINVIQDLGEVLDGRSLIYDVSKQQGQVLDSINLLSNERPESQTPPAAIITDWRDIIQPRSTEVVSDLLRDYHMVSLVVFSSRVAPTKDEERLLFRDRDKTIRCQKERELRNRETQATRREYTRTTIEYNRLLCEHEQRVAELAQRLRNSGKHNGDEEAEAEARQKMSIESPARMKSYLNDPMMVLLVRKGP